MSEDSDTDNSTHAVPMPHIKAPGPLVLSSDHENVQKKWSLWKQTLTLVTIIIHYDYQVIIMIIMVFGYVT